jgi:HAD superfamily hydrolase (TIGR01549 family)
MPSDNPFNDIKAVVFDVFGTLATIGHKRHPYRQVMQWMRQAGRQPQPDDATRLMANNVSLAGIGPFFNMEIPSSVIAQAKLDLYAELQTISLFDDAAPCLQRLREAGIRLGLCSNLAVPYAVPIKPLLPFELDAYVWSFEAGAVKPQAIIYRAVCDQLACAPGEVLMIGDTIGADYHGPLAFGMQAIHLARLGASPVGNAIATLDVLLTAT